MSLRQILPLLPRCSNSSMNGGNPPLGTQAGPLPLEVKRQPRRWLRLPVAASRWKVLWVRARVLQTPRGEQLLLDVGILREK